MVDDVTHAHTRPACVSEDLGHSSHCSESEEAVASSASILATHMLLYAKHLSPHSLLGTCIWL